MQRVVVLGRPTLSRPVQALLARPDVEVLVIAPPGLRLADAGRAANRVLAQVPPGLLRGNLGAGLDWLARWQRAGVAAARAVTVTLRAAMGRGDCPTRARAHAGDGHAQRDEGRPGGRAEQPGAGPRPRRGIRTRPHRAGQPWAGRDRRTFVHGGGRGAGAWADRVRAYVGDVTFTDVGGLLTGPLERVPDLQVVVANDDGGSIFATLEHGDQPALGRRRRSASSPHPTAPISRRCALRCNRGPQAGQGHVSALHAALVEPIVGRSVVEVIKIDRGDRRGSGAAHRGRARRRHRVGRGGACAIPSGVPGGAQAPPRTARCAGAIEKEAP